MKRQRPRCTNFHSGTASVCEQRQESRARQERRTDLRLTAAARLQPHGLSRRARVLAGTLAGFWLALSAGPSFALDLAQAWQDALANDSRLASARAQLDATRERVPQARSQLLPAIGASAGVNRIHADPNIGSSQDFTSRAYAIQLSMPLLGLPEKEVLEQSRLAATAAEAAYTLAQQDLILRLARTYFDVLSAQDSLETIQAQKRAIAEQLESARRNFEVGTATITDQQEAQARFDLADAQEIAARNTLEVQRALLTQLIGRPVDTLDRLRADVHLQAPAPQNENDWVRQAIDASPAVRQQQLNVEIARREIDRRRYTRYPSVDLVGSIARNENAAMSAVGLRTNTTSVGVQLSIPLYTGGGIEAGMREAAALFERSRFDLQTTQRDIEQATRQAWLGVNSTLAQVEALKAAQRSSQLALESNLLGYQVGVRINIDVLNAQQQLFSTERDLARARYDVIVNGLTLKSAAGILGEEDVTAVNTLLTDDPAAAATPHPAAASAVPALFGAPSSPAAPSAAGPRKSGR